MITPAGFECYFDRIAARISGTPDGSAHAPRHEVSAFVNLAIPIALKTREDMAMETAGGGSTRPRARADWRTRYAAPPQRSYTSETKPFFLTSEFLVFILFVMGLAIGTSTADDVDPRLFWILTTVATSAYMLSRGIAKAATRSRAYDPREDLDLGRDDER